MRTRRRLGRRLAKDRIGRGRRNHIGDRASRALTMIHVGAFFHVEGGSRAWLAEVSRIHLIRTAVAELRSRIGGFPEGAIEAGANLAASRESEYWGIRRRQRAFRNRCDRPSIISEGAIMSIPDRSLGKQPYGRGLPRLGSLRIS